MWRLRRATAIETGLLQIHADILRNLKGSREAEPGLHRDDSHTGSPFGTATGCCEDQHWAYSSSRRNLPDILVLCFAITVTYLRPKWHTLVIERCRHAESQPLCH
jgi:hypothetical protein